MNVFKSPFLERFEQELNDRAGFFKRKYGLNGLNVRLNQGEDSYTDGETIVIGGNTTKIANSDLTSREKVVVTYGTFFHEVGHLLYSPFSVLAISRSYLYGGSFYPDAPENVPEELKEFLAKGEAHRARAYTFYKLLQNILEDGRIEYILMNGPCSRYRIYNAGLRLKRTKSEWEKIKDLDEWLEEIENAEDSEKATIVYQMVYSLCFQLGKFGELKGYRDEHYKIPMIRDFVKLSRYTASAVVADTAEDFQRSLNQTFCALFKHIKPYLEGIDENQESLTQDGEGTGNGEGESASGKASGQPKTSSAAEEPLQKMRKELGMSDKGNAMHGEGNQKAQKELQSGTNSNPIEGEETDPANPFAGQSFYTKEDKAQVKGVDLDAIQQRITKGDEQNNEKTQKKEKLAVTGIDFGEAHKNVSWHINAVQGKENQALYEMYRTFSEKAVEAADRLKENLPDASKTFYSKGHYFGQRLNQRRFYDIEQRHFDRKIEVPGPPTLSVAILVDQSGSMRGDKISWVRAMTIMLFEMCRTLDVPYAVFGHNADDCRVYIDNYCYFGEDRDYDKYKLLSIDASRCNRDGAALRYTCEKLASQQSQRKLLFVISDGRPNDGAYFGDVAARDIQEAILEYERRGVNIIAAAIDQDKDAIQKIYGSERFLDITSLEDLPQIIGDIVQRNVV